MFKNLFGRPKQHGSPPSSPPFTGHTGRISGIAFSPDGSEAVSGAYSHQRLDLEAMVWRIPDGGIARQFHDHTTGIFSVAYSPDGRCIATGGGGVVKGAGWIYDHEVRLWDAAGKLRGRFGSDLFFPRALAFSPDGRSLLTGSDNSAPIAETSDGSSLRLWSLETLAEVRRFGRYTSGIQAVAFSPDGRFVVSGSTSLRGGNVPGGSTVTVKIYREGDAVPAEVEAWSKPQLLKRLEAGEDTRLTAQLRLFANSMNEPDRISYSTEITSKETASSTSTIRCWDAHSGDELPIFHHDAWVNQVVYAPAGQYLFSFGGRGVICWDAASGAKVGEVGQAEIGIANCGAISPDGKFIAVGTGGKDEIASPYTNCFARVVSTSDFSEFGSMQFALPVTAMSFSPNSRYLLVGGEFGEIRLWPLSG